MLQKPTWKSKPGVIRSMGQSKQAGPWFFMQTVFRLIFCILTGYTDYSDYADYFDYASNAEFADYADYAG